MFLQFLSVGKDQHRKGILGMQIHEEVKLMLCYLLHHLNDVQLRHRVEYTISFAQGYMGALQTDQLRRYVEIKQSDMPSAVAAKKTKEFRCPPRDQVNNHSMGSEKLFLGFFVTSCDVTFRLTLFFNSDIYF